MINDHFFMVTSYSQLRVWAPSYDATRRMSADANIDGSKVGSEQTCQRLSGSGSSFSTDFYLWGYGTINIVVFCERRYRYS